MLRRKCEVCNHLRMETETKYRFKNGHPIAPRPMSAPVTVHTETGYYSGTILPRRKGQPFRTALVQNALTGDTERIPWSALIPEW